MNPARIHVAAAQTTRLIDDVAIDVDLHQVRSPHLVEIDAIFVDQKMMIRPRQARAQVGVDEIGSSDDTLPGDTTPPDHNGSAIQHLKRLRSTPWKSRCSYPIHP